MPPVIYTVGHSTRRLEEFLRLLSAHGVEGVVDVRRYPASRRHPHFAREALAGALAAAAIAYRHEPDLGGRRAPRGDSANVGWKDAGFRGYADHMATTAFRAALERLIEFAEARPTAILCAEAVPSRCHRQHRGRADGPGRRSAAHRRPRESEAPSPVAARASASGRRAPLSGEGLTEGLR